MIAEVRKFRKELFLDETLIAELGGGARRRLHAPVPQEVVMVYDRPWEGTGCGYHTVMQDGELYRMYYKAWNIPGDGDQSQPVVIAYAESRDGVNWERPNLGLVEFGGSKENNIIFAGLEGRAHDFSPFLDLHPDADPRYRYKAVGRCRRNGEGGLYLFQSEDAIHWSLVQETAILEGYPFDTQNLVFYDPEIVGYRAYIREFRKNPDGSRGGRGILATTSSDLLHWSKPEWVEFPRDPEEELYTNQVQPYPGVSGLLIGFPARYVDRKWVPSTYQLPELEARKSRSVGENAGAGAAADALPHELGSRSRYGSAVTDTLLMTSRDGRTFYRWEEAFLRPGLRTRHNWSYGDNYLAWGLPITPSTRDDSPPEISLYATESYFTPPSCRLRRFTVRQDGIVSLFAPNTGGDWLSPLIAIGGKDLCLNFSTSAGGGVWFSLETEEGKAIPGYGLDQCPEMFGDDLKRPLRWSGDRPISACGHEVVRLRAHFREADLFALEWA